MADEMWCLEELGALGSLSRAVEKKRVLISIGLS